MAFAPVVEDATFGIADFAVLLFLIGLLIIRFTWSVVFHPIFATLAAAFNFGIPTGLFGTIHPLRGVAHFLDSIDNAVYSTLGQWINQSEHAFHKFLLWQAYVLTKTGDEIAALAHDTWQALSIVHAKTQPAKIQAAAAPAVKAATATLPRVVVKLDSRVPALEREIAATNAKVTALQHSIALPHSIAIPRTLPKVGSLERDLKWVKGELGKLKWAVPFAGVLGLGAALLSKLGLNWTRCSNVNKTGKQLCGMNTSLLESLLADTLLIVGTVSLVEFAEGMQGITGEIVGPIRAFWRAT